jgi:hypothetical protein
VPPYAFLAFWLTEMHKYGGRFDKSSCFSKNEAICSRSTELRMISLRFFRGVDLIIPALSQSQNSVPEKLRSCAFDEGNRFSISSSLLTKKSAE